MNPHIHVHVCVYNISIKSMCSIITITVFRRICIEVCMTVYSMKYVVTNIYEIGLKTSFWSFLYDKFNILTIYVESFHTDCGNNIMI